MRPQHQFPPPASRFRVPFLVWMGTALLTVSVVGIGWGLHVPASPSRATDSQAESLPRRAVCFGHVDAEHGVIPLYPLQPGRVVKVLVRDNQPVEAGKPIFQMDDTLARAMLAEAGADLEASQTQLEQARQAVTQHQKQIDGQQAVIRARRHELGVLQIKQSEAKRLADSDLARKDLFAMAEEGVKAMQANIEAEQAKLDGLRAVDPQSQVTRARQAVEARRAQLKKAEFALKECQLLAPSDGTVLRLLVNEGETLGPNPRQPAVHFEPKGKRIIRAEIEQEFAPRVALNQTALIQDDTRSGPNWRGKVVRISEWFSPRRSVLLEPLQFNDVRTLECIIELDEGTPPLRIGQRMRVILEASGN